MNRAKTRQRTTPLDPALSKIPEPPEEFGQDGGKFYECYDKLAADMDDDMTFVLKEQLEGLLLFAGLFAGINTSFLFLTLPMLWADGFIDPNILLGQTNEILISIARGQNDSSILFNADIPPRYYEPSTEIVTINVLFCLSLILALVASFLAMLGRQWLFYYRKKGGGGPDRVRWAQLQRFLGAQRWHLELILDDALPSILQIALILFCIALVTFLRTVNLKVSTIVSIPLILALAFIGGTALCVTWDKFCPFQSPLSHLFEWIFRSIPRVAIRLAKGFTSFSQSLKDALTMDIFRDRRPTPACIINVMQDIKFSSILGRPVFDQLIENMKSGRKEKPLESLQIFALQRSLCTSEDPSTLLCAVANIPTITNPKHVQKLWDDKAFQERLLRLYMCSFDRTLRLLGRDQVDLAHEAKRLYGAAVTHILFYLDHVKSVSDFILPCLRDTECFKPLGVRAPQSISDDTLPVFVQTSLAHALICILLFPPLTLDIQNLCAHLNSCSDALVYPDWRLLSLISWAVAQLPRIGRLHSLDFGYMAKAFRGDVDTAPQLISQAFEVIIAREHVYTLDCEKVLINLLRCSSQVVTGECPHPEMRMEQTLVFLRCAEKVLRSAGGSSEMRTLVERMRDAVAPKFKKTCVREHSLWSEITTVSPEILDTLISLFQALTESNQTQSSKDENMKTFEAFKPLLDNILSTETVFEWENGEHTADERPKSLVQGLNTLRQVLKQFIPELDVYRDDSGTSETDISVSQESST
ncbi:hypothetical protein FS837_001427 [Tulasnella sp. UAMH 9824]|nr:hypothetical protein FS837_001427 [Tulasnella sp. UAMH 9824]